MAEEDVKKQTELWEEVLRVKRNNAELQRQVSQFAALSGDKVQGIQDRMLAKESTVAILQERTSKGIETQAEERSALQSQVTALSMGLEEMQQQLRMERRLRERAQSETRESSTELKTLLDSQKEALLNKIEETRDATWTERGAERESESKMQKFRDDKAEHHVDSTRGRFDMLEKALREERADRIRFEKAVKDDVHADIQRIEAGEGREKAAAGITMQKFLQGVRVRLKKMRIEIEDIRDDAGAYWSEGGGWGWRGLGWGWRGEGEQARERETLTLLSTPPYRQARKPHKETSSSSRPCRQCPLQLTSSEPTPRSRMTLSRMC